MKNPQLVGHATGHEIEHQKLCSAVRIRAWQALAFCGGFFFGPWFFVVVATSKFLHTRTSS